MLCKSYDHIQLHTHVRIRMSRAHGICRFTQQCAAAGSDCSVALPCDVGYEKSSKVCTPCPVGKHSSTGVSCEQCETGKISAIHGASACTKCSVGTVSPRIGDASCTACDQGKVAASQGLSVTLTPTLNLTSCNVPTSINITVHTEHSSALLPLLGSPLPVPPCATFLLLPRRSPASSPFPIASSKLFLMCSALNNFANLPNRNPDPNPNLSLISVSV